MPIQVEDHLVIRLAVHSPMSYAGSSGLFGLPSAAPSLPTLFIFELPPVLLQHLPDPLGPAERLLDSNHSEQSQLWLPVVVVLVWQRESTTSASTGEVSIVDPCGADRITIPLRSVLRTPGP